MPTTFISRFVNRVLEKKCVLDGPPSANGQIRLGRINKVLKDIIIKSRVLDGFDTMYRVGTVTVYQSN